MQTMIKDPVLINEYLLDKPYLMNYVNNNHVDIQKANTDNINLAIIYRSAFYWHVQFTRKQFNDDNYDYIEFILDYIEARLSNVEMTAKYSNVWFRQVGRMELHRSKTGLNRISERKRNSILIYDNSDDNRKPLTEFEQEIQYAKLSENPIISLLHIDYHSLSDSLDNSGHLELPPYVKHELQPYDDISYIDPYVNDGGRIIRKEILSEHIHEAVKTIANILNVNDYEIYRSAFHWHMHTLKSSHDLHGDYGEFVQDYSDARLNNHDFSIKYGNTARKLAYKMKLERSKIGRKRARMRQSGKLNDHHASSKSKARKILEEITTIGAYITDIDHELINVINDADMSEAVFIRMNHMRITPFQLRRFEYENNMFLNEVINMNVSIKIDPDELYELASCEYMTPSELAIYFNTSIGIIRKTMSFYGIKPDYSTDEFREKRKHDKYINHASMIAINDYDDMSTVDRRTATYKLRTGYDHPMQNPIIREKQMNSLERSTGFRKTGAANPVILSRILKTRAMKGMTPSNFESSEWQDEYGGHGFSNGPSISEMKIIKMMSSIGINNDSYIMNNRTVLHGRELDFYFADNSFAIEVSPSFTHNSNIYPICDIFQPKPADYHYDKMNDAMNENITLATLFDWMLTDDGIRRIVLPYVEWRMKNISINANLGIKAGVYNMQSNDGRGYEYSTYDFNLKIDNEDDTETVAYCQSASVNNMLIIDSLVILDYKYADSIMNVIEQYSHEHSYDGIMIMRSLNLPMNDVFIRHNYECMSVSHHVINYVSKSQHNQNIVISEKQALELAYEKNNTNIHMSNEEYIEKMLTYDGVHYGFNRQYDCGYGAWAKMIK